MEQEGIDSSTAANQRWPEPLVTCKFVEVQLFLGVKASLEAKPNKKDVSSLEHFFD